MPTILTRTFALLNNIKPPAINLDEVPSVLNEVGNPEIIEQVQPEPQQTEDNQIQLDTLNNKPDISIWKAAEVGDIDALQYFINHTTSVDPTVLLNTRDPDTDCTLLHLVVSNNRDKNVLPILQLLLEHGADAVARNIYNVQAIHMVSLHCPAPLASIELLLNYKASPNARDGDGWTPLHYAARFCNPPDPVLELLVSRGADVNLTDAGHKTPLFGLLANGDLSSCLDWLIHTAKANVGARGDFLDPLTRKTRPGTIVLQAAKYGRLDCLSLLIRSPVAMEQLKNAVDWSELEHARYLIHEARLRIENKRSLTSSQTITKLELISQLLQELEDVLANDPTSLVNRAKIIALKEITVTSAEPNQQNRIQRRHTSFMTMLGSIRRSGRKNNNSSPNQSSALLRKMTRIVKRSKSESTAQDNNNTQSGSTQ